MGEIQGRLLTSFATLQDRAAARLGDLPEQPGPAHRGHLFCLGHLQRVPGGHAGGFHIQPAGHPHQEPRQHRQQHRHRPPHGLQLLHQLHHHPGAPPLPTCKSSDSASTLYWKEQRQAGQSVKPCTRPSRSWQIMSASSLRSLNHLQAVLESAMAEVVLFPVS